MQIPDAAELLDDLADDDIRCSACGELIGMFIGRAGWQHYRGEGTAASPVEIYDAGHQATLTGPLADAG